jgi:Na+-driven multidrug efflux pump
MIGAADGLTAAGILSAPTIVAAMGTPEPARSMAVTYLRWTCATFLSQFVFVVMLVMLRNTGDAEEIQTAFLHLLPPTAADNVPELRVSR